MKNKKHLISIIISLSFILILNSVGIAQTENYKGFDLQARKANVNDAITRLSPKGPEAVEKWLLSNGFTKVEPLENENNEFEPTSFPADADITDISVFYDEWADQHIVTAAWKWVSIDRVDTNVDPNNVVSLSLHNTNNDGPLQRYTWSSSPGNIAVYDQYGTHYPNVGSFGGTTQSAIIFSINDHWAPGYCYVGYEGRVWGYLDDASAPFYAKMEYKHTYNEGQISGYGFNFSSSDGYGLFVNWSIVGQEWSPALNDQKTFYSW